MEVALNTTSMQKCSEDHRHYMLESIELKRTSVHNLTILKHTPHVPHNFRVVILLSPLSPVGFGKQNSIGSFPRFVCDDFSRCFDITKQLSHGPIASMRHCSNNPTAAVHYTQKIAANECSGMHALSFINEFYD